METNYETLKRILNQDFTDYTESEVIEEIKYFTEMLTSKQEPSEDERNKLDYYDFLYQKYGSVEDVTKWVIGLWEKHSKGALSPSFNPMHDFPNARRYAVYLIQSDGEMCERIKNKTGFDANDKSMFKYLVQQKGSKAGEFVFSYKDTVIGRTNLKKGEKYYYQFTEM